MADLSKVYGSRLTLGSRSALAVHAVDGVSFNLYQGETLALVGESGCGKSTLARLVMALEAPTTGTIAFRGRDLASLSRRELQKVRRDMQIVFQDPYASLDPKMKVGTILAEPMVIHRIPKIERDSRVLELLEMVGLHRNDAQFFPHQFSGGQRQRIAIARSLALSPSVLILDEPVTGLDVSIQAQVVNLLSDLQEQLGLTYLFIAHDLSVVRHFATRVAVMYLGRVVEAGLTEEVFASPSHPYTQALLSSVPVSHPGQRGSRVRVTAPETLSAPEPPSGCIFQHRCPKATDLCAESDPPLERRSTSEGHTVACHFAQPIDVLGSRGHDRPI